jgi:hypothetical protein
MTVEDIITLRVRPILLDLDASSYRWNDDLLIAFLNDGVQKIASAYPEVQLTGAYTMPDIEDVYDLSDTVLVDVGYRAALVDYICSRAYTTDGADRRDLARANFHALQFARDTGIDYSIPMPRG